VTALFRDELHYRYLGDWSDRDGNSNIDGCLLTDSLTQRDYSAAQISIALHKLRTEADNSNRSLMYVSARAVFSGTPKAAARAS
jgi:type I restriction enzyme R subunit